MQFGRAIPHEKGVKQGGQRIRSTERARVIDSAAVPNNACEVSIYRSPRVPDMYLFVPTVLPGSTPEESREDELSALLPVALLERFGEPVFSFSLALWPERPLAQANAATVLAAISKQGFYLQLPPTTNGLAV